MLVLQQVAVLPAGALIVITDEGKEKLKFIKATHDDSLKFDSVYDYELYYKVYSNFRCEKLNAFLKSPDFKQGHNFPIYYSIEVRG